MPIPDWIRQVLFVGKSGNQAEVDKDGNQLIKAAASDVILPMDKQAQLKQQIENNTTPLGASATYTGATFDTMADGINYTWLTGLCVADQGGTLYIDQSADGTNFVSTDSYSIAAFATQKINIDILCRYLRLRLVNGATAQTSLKLYGYVTFKG